MENNNNTPLWGRIGLRVTALLGGIAAVYASTYTPGTTGVIAGLAGTLLVIGALIGD